MNLPLYSIYSFDCVKKELENDNVLYNTEQEAIKNINIVIMKFLKETYKIYVDDNRLFLSKKSLPYVSDVVKYNIDAEEFQELVLIKTKENCIEMYLKGTYKGYLYNKEHTVKKYKFFIVKHEEIECKDDTGDDEKTHIVNIKRFEKNDFNNDNQCYNSFLQELKDKIKFMKDRKMK